MALFTETSEIRTLFKSDRISAHCKRGPNIGRTWAPHDKVAAKSAHKMNGKDNGGKWTSQTQRCSSDYEMQVVAICLKIDAPVNGETTADLRR
jgi:hypothetical protein